MPKSYPFSRKELISILEIIEAAHSCASTSGFRDVLLRAKDLIDAEFAICGTVRTSGADALEVVSAVNGNYPSEWCNHYLESGYSRVDPVVRYMTRYAHTQFWRRMEWPEECEKPTRKFVGQASDLGLRFGISSGIYRPEARVVNIFSFAGPKDVFGKHQRDVLEALTLHLNRALAGLNFSSETARPSGSVLVDA